MGRDRVKMPGVTVLYVAMHQPAVAAVLEAGVAVLVDLEAPGHSLQAAKVQPPAVENLVHRVIGTETKRMPTHQEALSQLTETASFPTLPASTLMFA